MQAVILAGGKGTRLRPITNSIPKPLVPIGDMPILEVVLKQLKYYGFSRVNMAVSHLAHLIKSFFGDGEKYNLKISYSVEDIILGTAGPISLLNDLDDDFLVMNGDVLTTINYSDLFNYHKKKMNSITIATYKKRIKIDLGVLEINSNKFLNYIEKPTYDFIVSMGIYVINKNVIEFIPKNRKYDMPELIIDMNNKGYRIGCYSGDYEWLDIGRIEDYELAVDLFEKNKNKYIPE